MKGVRSDGIGVYLVCFISIAEVDLPLIGNSGWLAPIF